MSVEMNQFLMQILDSTVFGLIGILLMVVGYKAIDFVMPADLNKEIEKGNISAGIIIAGVFIAVAIIVHAAIGW